MKESIKLVIDQQSQQQTLLMSHGRQGQERRATAMLDHNATRHAKEWRHWTGSDGCDGNLIEYGRQITMPDIFNPFYWSGFDSAT